MTHNALENDRPHLDRIGVPVVAPPPESRRRNINDGRYLYGAVETAGAVDFANRMFCVGGLPVTPENRRWDARCNSRRGAYDAIVDLLSVHSLGYAYLFDSETNELLNFELDPGSMFRLSPVEAQFRMFAAQRRGESLAGTAYAALAR